ncbi:MAG: DUF6090 family protein, partial [Moheibacter sp.]
FLSIFIAVISAFALNNWNDNRKDRIAESKILTEISNGLKKDLEDVKGNKLGHEQGIKSVGFFKKLLTQKDSISKDSIILNYFCLTRDFFSVQNTSGYETLKSKGLELIDNDSLRSKIISLYESDYTILRKFEEEFYETQFQENYFQEINHILAPNFEFDASKSLKQINLPLKMSEKDEQIFLIDLWKIEINRRQVLYFYSQVEEKINTINSEIEQELK